MGHGEFCCWFGVVLAGSRTATPSVVKCSGHATPHQMHKFCVKIVKGNHGKPGKLGKKGGQTWLNCLALKKMLMTILQKVLLVRCSDATSSVIAHLSPWNAGSCPGSASTWTWSVNQVEYIWTFVRWWDDRWRQVTTGDRCWSLRSSRKAHLCELLWRLEIGNIWKWSYQDWLRIG